MTVERLPGTWTTRDRPVLLAAARLSDQGTNGRMVSDVVAAELELDAALVTKSLVALHDAGYLTASVTIASLAGDQQVASVTLRERGRREVGLWPSDEKAAAALIELLAQAAEHVSDDGDAGALRTAGRLLRGVPSAVLADVTAALIRQQTGIG